MNVRTNRIRHVFLFVNNSLSEKGKGEKLNKKNSEWNIVTNYHSRQGSQSTSYSITSTDVYTQPICMTRILHSYIFLAQERGKQKSQFYLLSMSSRMNFLPRKKKCTVWKLCTCVHSCSNDAFFACTISFGQG